MKTLALLIALAASNLFNTPTTGSTDNNDGLTLTIEVSNVRNDRGTVGFALFTKDGFYKTPFMSESVTASEGMVSYTFTDLPAGDYAVLLHHDENEDGQMNFHSTGMPKEDWATSGTPVMGPPSWKENSFTLDADQTLQMRF